MHCASLAVFFLSLLCYFTALLSVLHWTLHRISLLVFFPSRSFAVLVFLQSRIMCSSSLLFWHSFASVFNPLLHLSSYVSSSLFICPPLPSVQNHVLCYFLPVFCSLWMRRYLACLYTLPAFHNPPVIFLLFQSINIPSSVPLPALSCHLSLMA